MNEIVSLDNLFVNFSSQLEALVKENQKFIQESDGRHYYHALEREMSQRYSIVFHGVVSIC